MAAVGQRRTSHVYSRAGFGRTVAGRSFRLMLRQSQTEIESALMDMLNLLQTKTTGRRGPAPTIGCIAPRPSRPRLQRRIMNLIVRPICHTVILFVLLL